MCLGQSHLGEHDFKGSFQDFVNPICTCGYEIKTTTHHLLPCSIYTNERMTQLVKIRNVNSNILEQNDTIINKDLLFGNVHYSKNVQIRARKNSVFQYFLRSVSLWKYLRWWCFEYSYVKYNNWLSYLYQKVWCLHFCSVMKHDGYLTLWTSSI